MDSSSSLVALAKQTPVVARQKKITLHLRAVNNANQKEISLNFAHYRLDMFRHDDSVVYTNYIVTSKNMITPSSNCSPSGFGLIGILIVVALLLVFTFGFQKLGSSNPDSEVDTKIGTYQPIGTGDIEGQLEAGFQAKEKARDTVNMIQDRTARDSQGKE